MYIFLGDQSMLMIELQSNILVPAMMTHKHKICYYLMCDNLVGFKITSYPCTLEVIPMYV